MVSITTEIELDELLEDEDTQEIVDAINDDYSEIIKAVLVKAKCNEELEEAISSLEEILASAKRQIEEHAADEVKA